MQDLEKEIASRKVRLEELRRQHEARVRKKGGRSSVHVFESPILEVQAPPLYTKVLQAGHTINESSYESNTDSNESNNANNVELNGMVAEFQTGDGSKGEKASSNELIDSGTNPATNNVNSALNENEISNSSHPTSKPLFETELITHLNAELKTFIDDACRCVLRSMPPAQPIKQFTKNTKESKNVGLKFELEWQLDLPTSSKFIKFSPNYAQFAASINADGTEISLWSLDSPESPEYTLVGAQGLNLVEFSQCNVNDVFAANEYGQVFKYDLNSAVFGGRFNVWPQIRSKEVGSGQVVGLRFVNPNFLISLHEDHKACLWAADILSNPVNLTNLQFANRAVDIVPTCMSLTESLICSSFGVDLCVVGTLDGCLFQLPQSGNDEIEDYINAHKSPVACLAFRPSHTQAAEVADMSDDGDSLPSQFEILASCGYDYSINIWFLSHASESRCKFKLLLTLPVSSTVKAMQWHPTEPAVLVIALTRKLEVWNLSRSLVAPIFSVPIESQNPSLSISTTGTQVLVTNGDKCSCYRLPVQLFETNDRWVYTNYYK